MCINHIICACHLEPPPKDSETKSNKTSIESLEQSYKELNSRKIKNSLSSFLLDVPGIDLEWGEGVIGGVCDDGIYMSCMVVVCVMMVGGGVCLLHRRI